MNISGKIINIATVCAAAAVSAGLLIWLCFSDVKLTKEESQIRYITVTAETKTTTYTEKAAEETVRTSSMTKAPVTQTQTKTSITTSVETTEQTSVTITYPFDLNRASFEEIVMLPDIGEVIAHRIIDYRVSHGGFRSRQELLNIEGIGESRYRTIYPLLYIEVEQILETVPQTSAPAPPAQTAPIPILDVNTATAEQFALLPGVDIELGRRITAFRQEIGGFSNILELLYVEGMTDSLYISIDEYLKCEAPFS